MVVRAHSFSSVHAAGEAVSFEQAAADALELCPLPCLKTPLPWLSDPVVYHYPLSHAGCQVFLGWAVAMLLAC